VFPIIEVTDDAAELTEQIGTKPKFWFAGEGGASWLFKESRPSTGEDWSEKVASELCQLIGLPRARYELATWRGRRGVVTPSFVPAGGLLIHGNDLLAQVVDDYPASKLFRVSEHTLNRVLAIMHSSQARIPAGMAADPAFPAAADVFVGYLAFDAWIANQDRHHQNWGLVRLQTGENHLAPSFDHASSLGRNETDEERRERLFTRDQGRSVEAYVLRARSALYLRPGDRRAMSTLDAFLEAAKLHRESAGAWLNRICEVETASVTRILDQVPTERISEPAVEFAKAILRANRSRLEATRREWA